MIGLHFFGGDRNFDATEIPSEKELKTADELQVELPETNADFHTLALDLARGLPFDANLPDAVSAATEFQSSRRKMLAATVRHATTCRVQHAEKDGEETKKGIKAIFWKLKTQFIEEEPSPMDYSRRRTDARRIQGDDHRHGRCRGAFAVADAIVKLISNRASACWRSTHSISVNRNSVHGITCSGCSFRPVG